MDAASIPNSCWIIFAGTLIAERWTYAIRAATQSMPSTPYRITIAPEISLYQEFEATLIFRKKFQGQDPTSKATYALRF